MNNITLRLATEKDIPTLLFIERKLDNLKTYSPILDEEEMFETFKKSVKYIIEKDGKIAGSYSYEIKSKDHAYIGGPAILPEFQGQGIAKEVTAIILDKLKNYKRIDLEVHPDNIVSLKLFKSFGFVEESRIENYCDDGEPRIVMVKVK